MNNYTPFLFKWGKLIGLTGGAQMLIQGMGFVVGIFIIRYLPVEQYAFYTLANTMLGTMTVLADGGIAAGVMAEGGQQWKDRRELGKILATGMKMRRQFAIGSLIVSVPILFFLLDRQGMEWFESLGLILCLTPAFLAALSGSILQIVPKLHQDINKLLLVNVNINVIRLLITLPVIIFFPFASLAILASGTSQVFGNLQLRKLSLVNAEWDQESSPEYRAKIMAVVKRILPGSIYYCISSQVVIWLVSIFNDSEAVAQVGALSRLMMVLTVMQMVIAMVITPRFARLPPNPKTVLLRFFQVMGLVVAITSGITLGVYLFPDLVLLILGNQYSDLQYEVLLMTIGSCLTIISAIINGMGSARAILPRPVYFITTIVVGQALVLYFLVDFTTVAGVLYFSIYSALLTIVYRVIHFIRFVTGRTN